MNEEELKKIWQTARADAPVIDFAALEKSLDALHNKLRRKIRLDIAVQIATLAVLLAIVWFYPQLSFAFWVGAVLAVWYVREILKFYRRADDNGSVKQFINRKFLAMKNFLWRTRIVLYAVPLVMVPAGFYAFGYFNDASSFEQGWRRVIFTLLVSEFMAIVLTEIYFKIFYASAVNELKDLVRQFDENAETRTE